MKNVTLVIFFCLSIGWVFGQTSGSYRSRQTGNWNEITTWQVFNGGWNNLETPGAGIYQNILPSRLRNVITISSNTTVTIPSGLEVDADQLEFGTNAVLHVASNGILNIWNAPGHDIRFFNDGVNFSQLTVSGFVRLQHGATMVNDNYAGTVIPASNSTTVNTYKMLSGGVHIHISADPLPYADWQVGSTLTFYATDKYPIITDVSVQFYNFNWDGRAQILDMNFYGTLRNVNGNLRVFNTNGRTVNFGTVNNYTMNIGGNLQIAGNCFVSFNSSATVVLNVGSIPSPGNFQVSNGTIFCAANGTTRINIYGDMIVSGGILSLRTLGGGRTDLNVIGDFSQSNGTITRSPGSGLANINFTGAATTSTFTKTAGDITNAINFGVAAGKTLDLGTSALTGSGDLYVYPTATLHVKSLDAAGAIQNNISGGNVRLSGARTYESGSTIVYDGAGTQFMGNGHPANPNTTIDNNDAVYMRANVTINGTLNLIDPLIIDNNTLTLGGTVTYGGGFLGITTLSNVVVNGSGAFGDLILAPVESPSPPNAMNNLTINRSGGGTVTLGNSLIVGGTFTHSNGTFLIGQAPGWSLTLRGPFSQAAGATISLFDNPIFIVEGTGSLPANINFTGTGLEELTMNRIGGTFNTTAALNIERLNLFNGVVNHASSNLSMYTNGVVTRSGGTINQLLGAQTSYDVIYDVDASITTGNEIPTVATRLDDLTKLGTGAVTLDRDVIVNGTFGLTEGLFDVGTGNDVTINGDFIVDGTFEGQQGLVTFGGAAPQMISGASSITFYDVAVNQTASSTVGISTNVSVENSFAVNSASTVNAGDELLTLLSTATRTAFVPALNAGAAIEGTVIAQRYLPNAAGVRNWRYITPTVEGSFVSDWKTELTITGTFSDPETGTGIQSNNPSMYVWDETFVSGGTYRYRPYPTSGLSSAAPLEQGRGYSVFGRTTGEIMFDSRGRLGQGQVQVNVTNSGGADPGWNLIGNPYPAPLDWDLVAASLPGVVENAVYITDNNDNGGVGGNVYYSDGVSVPASWQGILAPGQAFFINTDANATITFEESHKFSGQTQFFREKQIDNLLRISITGATLADELAIRLHDEATDLFDKKLDAAKFFKTPLAISTITPENQKLSINSISPVGCGKTVPIMIETSSTGSFTFNFTGLESFTRGTVIHLRDKLVNKIIDLATSGDYVFSSSDTVSLRDRFEVLVDGIGIEPTLAVTAESVCPNSKATYVTVSGSQRNVTYSLQWNGQNISTSSVVGTGSDIQLPLDVSLLPQGEQEISVLAASNTCSPIELFNRAVMKVDKMEQISGVDEGSVCEQGSVLLKVHGSAVSYNWYENETDTEPIATISSDEFITPVLTKTRTYYVAALNASGCEGDRKAVRARVDHVEPVTITQEGQTLISSRENSNQWFLDGSPLDGASSKHLEVSVSGNYSLQVTDGACLSSASLSVVVGDEYAEHKVIVYPNPTASKVTIEVMNASGDPNVKLVSPVGIELKFLDLQRQGQRHFGELDLGSYAPGVYLIQVNDGQKTFVKKVSKL